MLQSQTEQTDESQSRISRLQLDVKKLSDDLKKRKRDVAESILNTILQDRYYETVSEVTKADLDPLRDRTIYYLNAPPRFARDRMANALRANGYTPDDVGPVHEELGLSAPIPNAVVFEVPLSARRRELLVAFPSKRLNAQDVFDPQRSTSRSKVSYPIESIRVLGISACDSALPPGMCCCNSGARQIWQAGQRRNLPIRHKCIKSRSAQLPRLAVTEVVRLPVLGLIYEDRALLAIIERATLATVPTVIQRTLSLPQRRLRRVQVPAFSKVSGTGSDDAFRVSDTLCRRPSKGA